MRKNSIKNTRINGEVRRVLSSIIQNEIKDPRIHPMTSVVEVEPELEPEVEPALEVPPPLPQAARPRAIAAARVSARAFFIAILLFSCFK